MKVREEKIGVLCRLLERCNGKSWGIFSQKKEKGEIRQELQVLYGEKDVSVIN